MLAELKNLQNRLNKRGEKNNSEESLNQAIESFFKSLNPSNLKLKTFQDMTMFLSFEEEIRINEFKKCLEKYYYTSLNPSESTHLLVFSEIKKIIGKIEEFQHYRTSRILRHLLDKKITLNGWPISNFEISFTKNINYKNSEQYPWVLKFTSQENRDTFIKYANNRSLLDTHFHLEEKSILLTPEQTFKINAYFKHQTSIIKLYTAKHSVAEQKSTIHSATLFKLPDQNRKQLFDLAISLFCQVNKIGYPYEHDEIMEKIQYHPSIDRQQYKLLENILTSEMNHIQQELLKLN